MATSPDSSDSLSQIQSLRCAVCLSILTEPKLLDCAHTLCMTCMTQLLRNNAITCPFCRACTNVPDGDVTKLKTNVALKAIVDDLAQLEEKCETCGSMTPRKNLSFCSACCKFMCLPCVEKHNKDERNSDHVVATDKTGTISIRDLSTATSSLCRCANHSAELCVSVCIQCNAHVCKHCVQYHIQKEHRVKSITAYISELFAGASHLEAELKGLSDNCNSNLTSAVKNERKTKIRTDMLKRAFQVQYEISIAKLKDRKECLTKYCDDLRDEAVKLTTEIAKDMLESLCVAQNARAKIESTLQSPFDYISLYESLFEKNRVKATQIKDRTDERMKLSSRVVETAESLHFVKSQPPANIIIGSLKKHTWERTKFKLRSDKMTDTAVSPDGNVAVGYFDGGIELINKTGSEGTVLKHVKVLAIAWFPNGDLAVRDTDNCLSVYSNDLKRSNVSFTTLGHYEGGDGAIVVNSASEILMGYRHVFQIHFFLKKGGKAFRVIKCVNYVPQQLVPTLNSDILVMDASVMRIIDKQGNIKSQVEQPEYFGYPAIFSDGSVIIAWVNEDGKSVRIEQYTHELKSKNKLLEASLGTTARKWYKLQAISCDRIFFCSPNTMHYFWLTKTSVGEKWSTWL